MLGVSVKFLFMLLMNYMILNLCFNRILYYLVLLEFLLLGVFFSLCKMAFLSSILLNLCFMSILACEAGVGLSILVLNSSEAGVPNILLKG